MPPAVILLARSCSRGGLNAVPPSDYGDMSTSVLRGIILLLGCVICVLSTYGVFAPFKLTNWVRSAWGKKPTFPFTVIVRLVMGSILIFAAPESRFPVFFEVLGWFFVVAGIIILVSGRDRTGRMLNWFEGFPAWAISLWCLLGIFFGGFLIYGVCGGSPVF